MVGIIRNWLVSVSNSSKQLDHAKELQKAGEDVKAFGFLSKAAMAGEVEAKFLIGKAYMEGRGVPVNVTEAAKWLQQAAKDEWPEAQYTLAVLYLHGLPENIGEPGADVNFSLESDHERQHFKPDIYKACEWVKKAAEAGLVDAEALYGYILSSGPEDIVNKEEAQIWYEKALREEAPQAYLGLGLMKLQSAKTDEERLEAAGYLQKAADKGLSTAQYMLGCLIEQGITGKPDLPKVMEYFKSAAEQGVGPAQARYGLALMQGVGVEKNDLHGESWLRRAALGGDREAAALLGDLYVRGLEGKDINYFEGVQWYIRAAEAGHAKACIALASLFFEGKGVLPDKKQAISWLTRGLELGSSDAGDLLVKTLIASEVDKNEASGLREQFRQIAEKDVPLGLFNYAVCLVHGIGGEADMVKGAQYMSRAAEKGIVNAELIYGRMLLQGEGVEKNLTEARKYLKAAAEAGMGEAQMIYAAMLVDGQGGEKNHPLAMEYYKKAIEHGQVGAMFSLGAMYGGGHDVPEDRQQAQIWFTHAADAGFPAGELMLGRYLAYGWAGTQDLPRAKTLLESALKKGITQAQDDLDRIHKAEEDARRQNRFSPQPQPQAQFRQQVEQHSPAQQAQMQQSTAGGASSVEGGSNTTPQEQPQQAYRAIYRSPYRVVVTTSPTE